MPDATPPLDQAAIAKAVADAVASQLGTALSAALKPITDQIAALAPSAAAAKPEAQAATEKPLSAAEIVKLLDERDAKRSASAEQTAKRQSFLDEKLKDLPEPYRKQLGSDPAKFGAEEQAIRDGYRADMAKAGLTIPNKAGDQPAGAAPADVRQPVDLSKLNPVQLIQHGLKTTRIHKLSGGKDPAVVAAEAANAQ